MKKTLKESLRDINNMMSRVDHQVIREETKDDHTRYQEKKKYPNTTLKHDDKITSCINCRGNKPGYIEAIINNLYGNGEYGIFLTKVYQAPHSLLKGYYILKLDDKDLSKPAILKSPQVQDLKFEIGEEGGVEKM